MATLNTGYAYKRDDIGVGTFILGGASPNVTVYHQIGGSRPTATTTMTADSSLTGLTAPDIYKIDGAADWIWFDEGGTSTISEKNLVNPQDVGG